MAQNALAVACQLVGDLAAARAHLEAVLQEARRLDDADNLARGLNNLASVAHAGGHTAEAVRLYGESRTIFGSAGIGWRSPGCSTRRVTPRGTGAIP